MNVSISLENLLVMLSTLNNSNKRWLAERLYEQTTTDEDLIEAAPADILEHTVSLDDARQQLLDMVHEHYHQAVKV